MIVQELSTAQSITLGVLVTIVFLLLVLAIVRGGNK